MKESIIKERLAALRVEMEKESIDIYLFPTADYHHSEYVDGFFKTREYFSGFTGSAGTLVVTRTEAGLWTDGRYFIQAEKELEGTGVTLYRMMEEGVPTVLEYLCDHLEQGQTLGFDGRVITADYGEKLEKKLAKKEIELFYEKDLAQAIWTDRPALACGEVFVLPDSICGHSLQEKVEQVRKKMKKKECNAHLLCKLDDLMWLFNIRGRDVPCNPVALSYGFLTKTEVHLFVQEKALSDEVETILKRAGVTLHGYQEIVPFLATYKAEGKVLIDKQNVSYTLYKMLAQNVDCVSGSNPTELLKAVKNEVELEQLRKVYLKDSAILTKFIYQMKTKLAHQNYNEYTAGELLDSMRSQAEGFLDLSFETICAYGANAAMMHYSATAEAHQDIAPKGMLLVDSGGQYFGGTTDVTRTFALGPVTGKMKEHFTAVAVGMLRLANAKFLHGCSGRNLDILARQPLWEKGIDYKCGTGHGIGYILNVHEGPQNIRWRFTPGAMEAVLEPGMIISDEPGVYLEGEYGIRTENIIEVVKTEKNGDGQFLAFQMLTYVPIDLDLIDKKWMEPKDVELLNAYHKEVYDRLAPFMEKEELQWLANATRVI